MSVLAFRAKCAGMDNASMGLVPFNVYVTRVMKTPLMERIASVSHNLLWMCEINVNH